ncbi:MAG TPA: hypothetical protein PKZ56_02595, partial [Candidatus Paceibacterota bacterium]|nr:hypothetical protein [Candidatus Paceibacterota bacterium]
MNSNNSTLTAALKTILNATKLSEIANALKDVSQEPTAAFKDLQKTIRMRIGIKVFMTLVALGTISWIVYMAYIGGTIVFGEGMGKLVLIFGIVDTIITLILAFEFITSWKRFLLIPLEVGSLIFLGYVMVGYFGSGNLRTATESKLMKDYDIVNHYYSDAKSTISKTAKTAMDAASVAVAEKARTGEGIVYDKGMIISSMKIDSVKAPDELATVPTFKTLEEANKYLHRERQKLNDMISDYKSISTSAKESAAGIRDGLTTSLDQVATVEQKSNLNLMISSMNNIANVPELKEEISDDVLNTGDLKADGYQGYFGYIFDIAAIAMVIIIGVFKVSNYNIREIAETESLALLDAILMDQGINFDPEKAKIDKVNIRQFMDSVNTVVDDPNLTKYIKAHMSFNDYLNFAKQYPEIAKALGGSKWQYKNIIKEIEADDDFVTSAVEAITIDPKTWTDIKNILDNPTDILNMPKEIRNEFLKLISKLNLRLNNPSAVKKFMGQFISTYTESDDNFLASLEICVTTLNPDQLLEITPEFVKITPPTLMKHICEKVGTKRLAPIIIGWKEQIIQKYMKLINDSAVSDSAHFDQFVGTVISYGSIDGIRAMLAGYHSKA